MNFFPPIGACLHLLWIDRGSFQGWWVFVAGEDSCFFLEILEDAPEMKGGNHEKFPNKEKNIISRELADRLIYIYMYIPGTQMTLVLIGKGLVLGVDLQKQRSFGFQVYTYLFFKRDLIQQMVNWWFGFAGLDSDWIPWNERDWDSYGYPDSNPKPPGPQTTNLIISCLEPICPLFLGFNHPKQGPFQSKQGSFGFQVTNIPSKT